MMHDHEKSDASIVAMNQANNAASAVAERGERREGAKGSAEQPATLRTQGRCFELVSELTRVSRTLQNGVILPEEVSNGKASDLQ